MHIFLPAERASPAIRGNLAFYVAHTPEAWVVWDDVGQEGRLLGYHSRTLAHPSHVFLAADAAEELRQRLAVWDQFVAIQANPVSFDDLTAAETIEAIDDVPSIPGEEDDPSQRGLDSGSSPTRSTAQNTTHADPTSPHHRCWTP